MEKMISREAALALLRQYNQEPFHIRHALTVEAVMRWFANDLAMAKKPIFGPCAACCMISTLRNGPNSTV